jgi:hypothetical protein
MDRLKAKSPRFKYPMRVIHKEYGWHGAVQAASNISPVDYDSLFVYTVRWDGTVADDYDIPEDKLMRGEKSIPKSNSRRLMTHPLYSRHGQVKHILKRLETTGEESAPRYRKN